MSVRGAIKDFVYFDIMVTLIVGSIIIFYQYFTTGDETILYIGFVFLFLIVFGAIARYRFFIDYVWTLLKRWR